jgi:hypothetical protein
MGMGGTTRRFTAEGAKGFVMTTLGVTRKFFDVAGSVRLVGVSYFNTGSENYNSEQLSGDGFATIQDRMWFFVEPVLTLRAGYKWVKLELDIGKSYKLNSSPLNYDSGIFTLALNVDVFRMFDR